MNDSQEWLMKSGGKKKRDGREEYILLFGRLCKDGKNSKSGLNRHQIFLPVKPSPEIIILQSTGKADSKGRQEVHKSRVWDEVTGCLYHHEIYTALTAGILAESLPGQNNRAEETM